MKNSLFLLLTYLFISACQSDANHDAQISDKASKTIEDISWLIGNWQDTIRPSQWEIWTKNKYGMHGRGLGIRQNDTVQFEELSLVEDNGQLIYIANVRDNDLPVKFVNTLLNSNQARFENSKHDFPKVISYKIENEGGRQILHATVGGDNKKIDLYYIKR